jgi:hypothetical protein
MQENFIHTTKVNKSDSLIYKHKQIAVTSVLMTL